MYFAGSRSRAALAGSCIPRADARRFSHRAPQPRHAVFALGVRPRCGTGDHHAARCGQALHVDAGDRRGPLRPRASTAAGRLHLHRENDRHALRPPAIRILVDPANPEDARKVHALQDAIKVTQPAARAASRCPTGIRRARRRCATRSWRWARPCPTRSAPSAARAGRSGRAPDRHRERSGAAIRRRTPCISTSPRAKNDGTTIYRLTVKATCRSTASGRSASTTPGATSRRTRSTPTRSTTSPRRRAADGSVTVQFGGCDGKIANCLPIMPGWNYMVRLYPTSSSSWGMTSVSGISAPITAASSATARRTSTGLPGKAASS